MTGTKRPRQDNALQKKAPGRAMQGRNTVRIIAGEWRGRRVRFPTVPGLRPTPDRVRETLFNWLQPVIRGARCLDLFAGSGALGLEALSRGAAEVVFVDLDPEVVRHLDALLAQLGCDRGQVRRADGLAWLAGPVRQADVIFLDPPFAAGLLSEAIAAVDRHGWLAPGGFLYVESPAGEGPPALPPGWTLHRSGRAGEVGYHLARRPGSSGPAEPGGDTPGASPAGSPP